MKNLTKVIGLGLGVYAATQLANLLRLVDDAIVELDSEEVTP